MTLPVVPLSGGKVWPRLTVDHTHRALSTAALPLRTLPPCPAVPQWPSPFVPSKKSAVCACAPAPTACGELMPNFKAQASGRLAALTKPLAAIRLHPFPLRLRGARRGAPDRRPFSRPRLRRHAHTLQLSHVLRPPSFFPCMCCAHLPAFRPRLHLTRVDAPACRACALMLGCAARAR